MVEQIPATTLWKKTKRRALRCRISPTCTLSQNGYGNGLWSEINKSLATQCHHTNTPNVPSACAAMAVDGSNSTCALTYPHLPRCSVICGARTHAELPPVDLKSTPLSHSGKLTSARSQLSNVKTVPAGLMRFTAPSLCTRHVYMRECVRVAALLVARAIFARMIRGKRAAATRGRPGQD